MSKTPNRGRKTPTQQQLLDLHNGVDQGGVKRSWKEVAAVTGFSHSYVTRIAYGVKYTLAPRPVVVIDPRDYESDLADMSDEDVAKWQAQPHCLCGCGQPTTQEHANTGRVPIGAYRMFLRAHWRRLPRYKEAWVARNRHPDRAAAIWETVKQKRVLAEDVSEVMWRWKCSESGRSLPQLARVTGLSVGAVQDIGRRYEYVKLLTAARLYAAMGEPMTREMAREYRKWVGKRTGLPPAIVQD